MSRRRSEYRDKPNNDEQLAALQADQAERQEAIRESEPLSPAPLPEPIPLPPILDLTSIPKIPAQDESPLMFGAPVSKSATPGTNRARRRIELTSAEAEIARLSGIDYKTYAKGKELLAEKKQQGYYQRD